MSKRDNLSLLLYGRKDLRLEQTPLPDEPESDEVQLATHTVGICGSDLHFYVHANCDAWTVKGPIIMGHESSATVVAIGSDVTNLKVGDRVAIEPGVTCHCCQFCINGRYNLCRKVVFQSCPPYHGSLRRLYNHKAYLCFKLPDNLSFGEGAIIEPLAVAVYGCQKLNLGKNQNEKVLVIGAGPVGLLTAIVARAYGVRDLCILDTNKSRLELATILGIPNILRINREDSTQNVVQRIKEIFGDLSDITMECTGVEACLNIAIGGTKEGGKVGLVGLNNAKVNVSLSNVGFNELELIGVRRYRDNCFSDAIDMVSSGQINIKPLISHVFKLEEAVNAFDTALKCENGVIKVQIECTIK